MGEAEIYTVFIAEDEQPARDLLTSYIFQRTELKLAGWSMNGKDALEKLSENSYDLAFVDINLPVLTGVEIIEKLEQRPYFIFTTAYDNYALKAFELGAVDYLLKPFSMERFNTAVDKALQVISSNSSRTKTSGTIGLSVKEDENYYILPYDEIIYLSSNGKYSRIHTKKRIYKTAHTLKETQKKLPADIFYRIHKKYVVNIEYISHVQYLMGGQYAAFLKDKGSSMLTIGRAYIPDLRGKLSF
ncbi:MAG: response regulator transcription factor [Spirochaetes bacterium]|nr:response regulator transcription factor [Spirochaetota bacterium]